MSILTCLPTYNEEKAVAKMIELLRKANLDFVVCDGFSVDRTVAIAEELDIECIKRDKIGKGSAVSKCLEIAHQRGYKYMGIIDCDLTYDIGDLEALYQLGMKEDYDLLIGARPFSKIALHRRLANILITGYFNVLFGSNVKDTLTGLRILKVEKYLQNINANSFDFEPRSIAFAIKNNLKCFEMPISYSERIGESKANLWELFLILKGITHERITS